MAVLILRTHYPTSKTVLACGSRRRKRFRPDENCSLWSPLHQYINDQQPHKVINNSCLFWRRPHKPASCDAFVWIQRGHATRKEVLTGFKHDMFGRQHLNFERALDIFKHNVGTPLTVKNFPKPETAQKSRWNPG